MSRRVVVVGAGITGLTIAYRILRSPFPVELLVVEADREPGGVIRSVQVGDLELEAGPDSFLVRKPWALDLCHELGLEGELVPQGVTASQILTSRGLLPVPPGRLGIPASTTRLWRWSGMSAAARLRATAEPLVPRRRRHGDQSVGALLRSHLWTVELDVFLKVLGRFGKLLIAVVCQIKVVVNLGLERGVCHRSAQCQRSLTVADRIDDIAFEEMVLAAQVEHEHHSQLV